jgi:hypothetical protein
MTLLAIRADYVETATSEDGECAFIQFKLSDNQEDHVLGIPTDQLPSLFHAAAGAYTRNWKLVGDSVSRRPAFAVKCSYLKRHPDTGGYVLTLTIGGGAELAFHFDRAGLDRMIETAQVVTGTLALKRPDVVN